MRDEGAAQALGGGAGELGFADAGLAAHQQWSAGGEGGVDGANLARLELVDGFRHVAGGGEFDDFVVGDVQEFHRSASGSW